MFSATRARPAVRSPLCTLFGANPVVYLAVIGKRYFVRARPLRGWRETRTHHAYEPVVTIHGEKLQGEHGGWGPVDLVVSGRCHNGVSCGPSDFGVLHRDTPVHHEATTFRAELPT